MTTLITPPVSKLGIDLQAFRTDRPDEWRMDEFTREAELMALRIKELEAALNKIVGIELSCTSVAMSYQLANKIASRALEQNE